MKILSVESIPFHEIKYDAVAPARGITKYTLPLLQATVDKLPEGIDGLIVTADLQGRETLVEAKSDPRLLGEVLAEELSVLSELRVLPSLSKIGVILAGDMFVRPGLDRRGGSGDSSGVWKAFADRCRWVAGVAGNHDLFSDKPSVPASKSFLSQPGIHFLDDSVVTVDGLMIGGVSGIIGSSRKPFRRTEADFLATLIRVAKCNPDLLVLHDGPDMPQLDLPGIPQARQALESLPPLCIIRGHKYWNTPFVKLCNGTAILNVDSRVVFLTGQNSSKA